uniref:Peptidase S1 domain-containing protein n=1 Tax=Loxodonta africana TaxID=9785 RepID=G3U8Z0_LOXAF
LLQMLTLVVLALLFLAHAAPGQGSQRRPGLSQQGAGGPEAPGTKWPWQVSLRLHIGYWMYFCRGSLVHSRWVLIAGHCAPPLPREVEDLGKLRVQLGEQHLYYHDQLLPLNRATMHPNFYSAQEGADIALLELKDPVNISSHLQLVALPPASETFPSGTPCWVTGWSDVDNGIALLPPYPLKQVKVPIVENSLCDTKYHSGLYMGDNIHIIRVDMMWAGKTQKDSCQGNSRVPLVCKVKVTWMLPGVVSWGVGCAQLNWPGMYTRTRYLDWIHCYVPKEP